MPARLKYQRNKAFMERKRKSGIGNHIDSLSPMPSTCWRSVNKIMCMLFFPDIRRFLLLHGKNEGDYRQERKNHTGMYAVKGGNDTTTKTAWQTAHLQGLDDSAERGNISYRRHDPPLMATKAGSGANSEKYSRRFPMQRPKAVIYGKFAISSYTARTIMRRKHNPTATR